MPNKLAEAKAELALGSRIAANEGVLDTFGHVSMRHPDNPNRYFLSRSSSPDMVTVEGLVEYDLDSRPVPDRGLPQYSERVIHGEIYKARADVMSVCHHHSPSFLPLIATGADYVPVNHLGAVGGFRPPYWDMHDEFGDTDMLVRTAEEGASLARALGPHIMVLMRRHGVTIVGSGVRDCIYRAVQTCRNAECLVRALSIGSVAALTPGETRLADEITGSTTGVTRSWNSWALGVARIGPLPPAKTAKPTRPSPKPRGGRKTRRR